MDRISAGYTYACGIHAAAQQRGNLVRVDLVILGFATVNRLHVECMTQHENDFLASAQIGHPVPREHAFHPNHDVLPEME